MSQRPDEARDAQATGETQPSEPVVGEHALPAAARTGRRARFMRSVAASLKDAPAVRAVLRKGLRAQRGLRYRSLWRRPIDPALIVFESFSGRSVAGSPLAIFREMLADPRFAGHRFVWSLMEPGRVPDAGRDGALFADPRVATVRTGGREAAEAFATAAAWVSSSIAPPEYFPRPGQRYVQTWHGTPLKRIGLDIIDNTAGSMFSKSEVVDRYRLEGRKVTHFLSSSAFTTRCFTSAFGLDDAQPNPLVQTGNPRNDVLALDERGTAEAYVAARRRIGVPQGTRVLLYCPTWRDDRHDARTGYSFDNELDLPRLLDALEAGGEKWMVLFRAHYLIDAVEGLQGGDPRIVDVSEVDDINRLYQAADAMVTDYSSAFFDYALLDRPMAFFMPDLEHYQGQLRGFYLDPAELPGPIVATQEELLEALSDADFDAGYAAARRGLVEKFAASDDGRASARVLDLLAEELPAARTTLEG